MLDNLKYKTKKYPLTTFPKTHLPGGFKISIQRLINQVVKTKTQQIKSTCPFAEG